MKKTAVVTASVLAALLLGGYTGFAADSVYELNPVVVTATRTQVEAFKANANTSVITRKQIEEGHYSNVQEALKNIPGVTIAGYGNTGETYSSNSLILNGSDNVVVLIDGVRANLPGSSSTYGKMATSELSNMNSIERIEVLKSSASTLYGADAAGGVINIITRKPKDSGVETKITAARGSFDKESYGLFHSGSKNGFYWELSAQKKISGNFKDGWGRTIPEHLNSTNNVYKIGKKFDEHADLNIVYQTYDADYLRPTGGWNTIYKDVQNDKYNTGKKENTKLNINYTQDLGRKVENRLSFYRYVHRADEKSWLSTYKSFNPYIYHYTTLGVSDQVTIRPNEKHTIVTGFDWYKDKVDHYALSADPNSVKNYSGRETTDSAIFINDEFDLTDTWHLSYGLRYNHNSRFDSKWLPSITIGNTPTDKLNYYIGYKKFFVAPYPSQMYGQYGNPDLEPITGYAIEGGVNYRFTPSFVGSAHFFSRDMDNTISADYNPSLYPNKYKYMNTGEEKGRGFDIQLRKNFSDKFGATVGYTYTHLDATSAKTNINSDGRIPVSQWNISLDYNYDKWNANFTALGNIAKAGAKSQAVNRSAAAEDYHTYWIFNATVNYQATKETNIYLKCNNIFDRLYTEQRYILDPEGAWYSAPGRYFEAGIEYKF